MPKIVKKSRVTKGKMARELVYYCLWAVSYTHLTLPTTPYV